MSAKNIFFKISPDTKQIPDPPRIRVEVLWFRV